MKILGKKTTPGCVCNSEEDVLQGDRQGWKELGPPPALCPGFAIWETPHTSTGFTPFKLHFRRQPPGLLDMALGSLGGTAVALQVCY